MVGPGASAAPCVAAPLESPAGWIFDTIEKWGSYGEFINNQPS